MISCDYVIGSTETELVTRVESWFSQRPLVKAISVSMVVKNNDNPSTDTFIAFITYYPPKDGRLAKLLKGKL